MKLTFTLGAQYWKYKTFKKRLSIIFLLGFFMIQMQAFGQCYTEFDMYVSQPSSGVACSAGMVTFTATNWTSSYGEFRWYANAGDVDPVQVDYVDVFNYYDQDANKGHYHVYVSSPKTMWVSFYNYDNSCETERLSDQISFAQPPTYNFQTEYAKECGDGIAHIKVTGAPAGTNYLLYETSSNTYISSSTTGIFEFDIYQHAYDYENQGFAMFTIRFTRSTVCGTQTYTAYAYIHREEALNAPTITSPTTCVGNSVYLQAINTDYYTHKWYNQAGTLLHTGAALTLPSFTTPGTYHYQVSSIGYNECESDKTPFTVTVLAVPSAPTGLTSTNIQENSFTANWNAVPGAIGYLLDVSTTSNFTSFVSGYQEVSTTTTNRTITGLSPNQTYYFRVRALNSSCTSVYSVNGSATTLQLLESPAAEANLSMINAPENIEYFDASTTYGGGYEPKNAKLFRQTGTANWSAASNTTTQYLKLFLGKIQQVTAISTQGRFNSAQWVKSYKFFYSLDGFEWIEYQGVLNANNDRNTVVTNQLDQPILAKYIRIHPQTWHSHISMRADVKVLPIAGSEVTFAASQPTGANTNRWYEELEGGAHVHQGATFTTVLDEDKTYYVSSFNTSNNRESLRTPVTGRVRNTALSQNLNYIITNTIQTEGITNIEEINNLTSDHNNQQITYYDGLGRPMQNVITQGSPTKLDIVQPIDYDDFGREVRKYLPYTGGSNGFYKPNGLTEQGHFYTTSGSPGKAATDNQPFAETAFEPSPLNRVLQQGAPGSIWQPKANPNDPNNHAIKYTYRTNTLNEVPIWVYTYPTSQNPFGMCQINGYYSFVNNEGQLSVLETLDEHNHKITEYTDKLGRVVLKKVQAEAGKEAKTFYVYDDFGNLRFVLPPEMVANMGASYTNSKALLDNWAFQYNYDGRRRMIAKKVPGAEPVYMVYDIRDRLVLTQDGEQRSNGRTDWLFTKYDALNRPVMTGETSLSGTQEFLQRQIISFYRTDQKCYEERGRTILGYTNLSYPDVATETSYLTVTYYDDYNFPNVTRLDYIRESGFIHYSQRLVRGQVTCTRTKILDGATTPNWLNSVVYYDKKYRVVQVQSSNTIINTNTDITYNHYDFTGKLLKSLHQHRGSKNLDIRMEYAYDHAGRLLTVSHQTNNSAPVLLAAHEYNELGELVTKALHSDDNGQTFTQQVDYRYNIRGWLTRINDGDLSDGQGDYFGMELLYHDTHSMTGNPTEHKAQYNGNIAAVKWKNAARNDAQAYTFAYDPMNRLTHAHYAEKNGALWNAKVGHYDENIPLYDLNGNIKKLDRFQSNGLIAQQIDELTYEYQNNNGNRLRKVSDNKEQGIGFKDGANLEHEYLYDANGNMNRDYNKGITNIQYNHLNLPKFVDIGTANDNITYTYDAAGTKLKKSVKIGNDITQTFYAGAIQYTKKPTDQEPVLDFMMTDEGRVAFTETTGGLKGTYQYFLKDHLGNNRVLFTTETETTVITASMEPANFEEESQLFTNIEETRQLDVLFNHTPGGSYSARLNGADNKIVGPATAIKVMTDDVVTIKVHAKYIGKPTNPSVVTGLIAAVASAYGYVPGLPETSAIKDFFEEALLAVAPMVVANDQLPKAYINYLLFDKDFKLTGFDYKQVTAAGDGAHEELTLELVPETDGYMYIYTSNETMQNLNVFFDDITITQTHSQILAVYDYYPFGMAWNNPLDQMDVPVNKYLYNGKELQNELDLNWLDYGARNYDASIGRFFNQDRFSEMYYDFTPYQYGAGNPIKFIDVNGDSLMLQGSGSQKAVDIANKASGGFYKANLNNGLVTYSKTNQKGTPTREQSAFIKEFSKVTDLAAPMTSINVVDGDKNVIIGDIANNTMDVGDMEKIGYDGKINAQGALIHEVIENYEVQANGISNIGVAHLRATSAENRVTGTITSPIRLSNPNPNGVGAILEVPANTTGQPGFNHTIKIHTINNNIITVTGNTGARGIILPGPQISTLPNQRK